MIDLAIPLQILGFSAVVALPAIVLNRLLADPDAPGLSELFRTPLDPPLPRGVQEEEPVRWRVELLRRPSVDDRSADRRLLARLAARDRRLGA